MNPCALWLIIKSYIEHSTQTVTQNGWEWTPVYRHSLFGGVVQYVCAKSVVADNYGSSQTVLWGVFGGLIQSSYGSGEAAISQSGGRFRHRWPCNVCQMEGVQTDDGMGVWSLHGCWRIFWGSVSRIPTTLCVLGTTRWRAFQSYCCAGQLIHHTEML